MNPYDDIIGTLLATYTNYVIETTSLIKMSIIIGFGLFLHDSVSLMIKHWSVLDRVYYFAPQLAIRPQILQFFSMSLDKSLTSSQISIRKII